MDFREKDTAIILVCCMLVVLLVIFFLSERQKFILNNFELSTEGSCDTYNLTVKKYKPVSDETGRELIMSRSLTLTRTLAYIGADNRGTMHLETRSPKTETRNAFFNETAGPVDLKVQFLPEGSCNFQFFDADLLNYRGEMVRKGETWKYLRPISLYGKSEKNVEIHYSFLGKKKHFEKTAGVIRFEIPDKTWLEGGLNSVENLRGRFLVSEETGKIEEAECSYYKRDEQRGFYYVVELKRVKSRNLSSSELAAVRSRVENPVRLTEITGSDPRKKMVVMGATGDARKLEEKIFPRVIPLYTIQLRAFTQKEQAISLSRKLKSKNWKDVTILRSSNIYKVCVGKHTKDSKELQSHFTMLKQYFPDAFITHPNAKEFQSESR